MNSFFLEIKKRLTVYILLDVLLLLYVEFTDIKLNNCVAK